MKSVTFKVAYDIGQTLKNDGGVYKVIGYEFIKGRGTRYVLLHAKSGSPEWLYVYDFEIKLLQ
jgi:rRNA maturation protein Rpf1